MAIDIGLMALMGGFVGSFHCIGMCGGFVCGLSRAASGSRRDRVIKNLFYNMGRLTSYCFIGAVLAAAGSAIATSGHGLQHDAFGANSAGLFAVPAVLLQRGLSILAGVLMLVMAFQLLGIHHHRGLSWSRFAGVRMAAMLQVLVQSKRPQASLALGVVNGFLPCPLVLSFAAIAAASASVTQGVTIMFAFGLGTFPAMLLMGGAGLVISPGTRQRGVRLSGMLLVVFAMLTIARGLLPMSGHTGHALAGITASEPAIAR